MNFWTRAAHCGPFSALFQVSACQTWTEVQFEFSEVSATGQVLGIVHYIACKHFFFVEYVSLG